MNAYSIIRYLLGQTTNPQPLLLTDRPHLSQRSNHSSWPSWGSVYYFFSSKITHPCILPPEEAPQLQKRIEDLSVVCRRSPSVLQDKIRKAIYALNIFSKVGPCANSMAVLCVLENIKECNPFFHFHPNAILGDLDTGLPNPSDTSQDMIAIPVVIAGAHCWNRDHIVALLVNFKEKQIEYHDSFGIPLQKRGNAQLYQQGNKKIGLTDFLEQIKTSYPECSVVKENTTAYQETDFDCGILVSHFYVRRSIARESFEDCVHYPPSTKEIHFSIRRNLLAFIKTGTGNPDRYSEALPPEEPVSDCKFSEPAFPQQ